MHLKEDNNLFWFEDDSGNKASPVFDYTTWAPIEGDTYLEDNGLPPWGVPDETN